MHVLSRENVLQEPLYDPKANISVFYVPSMPDVPLHVPMMKLHNGSVQVRELRAAKARGPTKKVPYPTFLPENKSMTLPVCHKDCSAADQLYPAWPARTDLFQVDFQRLGTPNAGIFKGCGGSTHWYCGHFGHKYVTYHNGVYHGCYKLLGIFERPDVRLVLDIGGATAGMAQGLHWEFGDRLLTITGAFWTTVRAAPRCAPAPTALRAR